LPKPTRDFARLSTIGVEFTITVGLFGWFGWKADAHWALFGKLPGFLLLGVLLGIVLGVYRMHLQLAAWQRSLTKKSPKEEVSALPEDADSGSHGR
jgi:putative F0F1-ATPase subunit (Ca2+/Mg2+ transporter)